MTVRSSINIHFSPGDVVHKHTRSYSTLDFGDHATDTKACLFFEDAAAVDTVIAELVALRAEMTGESADCGYQWTTPDGLVHACTRDPHDGSGHEAPAADGTRLTPETASVTA